MGAFPVPQQASTAQRPCDPCDRAWALAELFPGLEQQLLASRGGSPGWRYREGRLYNGHTLEYLHPSAAKADSIHEQDCVEAWLQTMECLQAADTPTLLQVLRSTADDFSAKNIDSLQALSLASIHDSGADLQTEWACKELATYLEARPGILREQIKDHRGGLLLLYGLGQGPSISRLLQATQPRIVVIFEHDKELLNLLLDAAACEALLHSTEQFNTTIFLVTDTDAELAYLKAKALIETTNLFAQERLFSFHFRQNDWFASLDNRFRSGDSLLRDLRYLGFFVDELHMMLNASLCLSQSPPRIISYGMVEAHGNHAVITASGPSLREALPLLKQHRENYDLFSCYSTLGVLLKNQIEPDYHCNQERHACHIPILGDPASRSYASQAVLLCSANNDPRMNQLYRDVVAFFRSASCASALFAPSQSVCISGEGPQVANLALYYAILMGYRTIHLFGVDLGCVDTKNKRVAGALSNTERDLSKPRPGNRRETIWTDQSLIESAEFMGQLIQGSILPGTEPVEDLKVFNYSDGQLIPGTIPSNPGQLEQNLPSHGSLTQPSQLVMTLNRYDSQTAKARFLGFGWQQRLEGYLAEVRVLIAEPLNRERHEQFLQLSEKQLNSLHDQILPRMMAGTLCRIWYYILMVDARLQAEDDKQQAEWQHKAHSILNSSLDSMEQLTLAMIHYVESLESIQDHQLRSCSFG